MAESVAVLRAWLACFRADARVAVDEGGLTLEVRTGRDRGHLEIGGWPEEAEKTRRSDMSDEAGELYDRGQAAIQSLTDMVPGTVPSLLLDAARALADGHRAAGPLVCALGDQLLDSDDTTEVLGRLLARKGVHDNELRRLLDAAVWRNIERTPPFMLACEATVTALEALAELGRTLQRSEEPLETMMRRLDEAMVFISYGPNGWRWRYHGEEATIGTRPTFLATVTAAHADVMARQAREEGA